MSLYMNMTVKIITPSIDCLESYKAALRTGWSPNTLRPEAAAEELEAISKDPHGFIIGLTDLEAKGEPIKMPDGSLAKRLPGFMSWIWDGEFCGVIGFRWQHGSEDLPPHVPGHVGYSVVPWKSGKGYATSALSQLLEKISFTGLRHISITTDPGNRASQRVVEKCGAVFCEEFQKSAALGGGSACRYQINLT
ncbi:MAG: GNAT family N-acetyltransferase [Gammaproteobacteria bacterium]|nr:GNAT family N-acetyltransferase [Gammaproteobacteria bacterium]